jgi:TonB family protein
MASILTPQDTPTGSPSEEERQLGLWNDPIPDVDVTPHVLIQLEDDLERARMREAFWISVVVHLLVVIFLAFSPKLFPGLRGVELLTPSDMLKDKQLTYLDMPPDLQKPPAKAPPDTKVLSDKNRVAMSKHPSIDKKTLQELKRAGTPGPRAPQQPPSQQPQMSQPMPQGQPAQQQQQQNQMSQLQPVPNPKLPTPQGSGSTPNFAQMMKAPGDLTQQAANSVASRRGSFSSGGGGDYGAGPGGSAKTAGNLEVLSDTQGVDFGPYLERVLQRVRMNWYNLIPEAARAPLMEKGKVAIEFAITPDGKVAGMKLTSPSGDVALDRAAWGGITASNPFAPLPSEFHGPYLALRFRFYYNPGKGDLE